jgi:hypothetical protein
MKFEGTLAGSGSVAGKDYGAWKLYNSDQVTAPDGTTAWQLQGWTPSASSGLLGGVDEPAPPGTLGSGGDCNFALLTLSPTESYKTIKITVNTVNGAGDYIGMLGGKFVVYQELE